MLIFAYYQTKRKGCEEKHWHRQQNKQIRKIKNKLELSVRVPDMGIWWQRKSKEDRHVIISSFFKRRKSWRWLEDWRSKELSQSVKEKVGVLKLFKKKEEEEMMKNCWKAAKNSQFFSKDSTLQKALVNSAFMNLPAKASKQTWTKLLLLYMK